MKIGTKFALAFAAVLTLTAATGTFALFQMGRVNSVARDIETKWMPTSESLLKIQGAINRYRSLEFQALLAKSPADLASFEKRLNELGEKLGNEYRQHDELIVDDVEARRISGELASLWKAYLAEHNKIIDKAHASDMEAALNLIRGESSRLNGEIAPRVAKLVDLAAQGSTQAGVQGDQLYSDARLMVAGLVLLSIVLGASGAAIIVRRLVKELGGEPQIVKTIASQISAGDLAVEIRLQAGDDHSIMFCMRTMRDSLARLVNEVRAGTEAIETAACQIASGNGDLSDRTTEQASSLEETASAMEELSRSVRQNSASALEANALAHSASEVAGKGGAVVEQVVSSMQAINASSRKIADIIGVIDSIAFQTNILALNAAVESARAGEQGRGFAVVASEVRNLAHRSAAAAKEIKELIGGSVVEVEHGTTLVEQAGATMREIVSSVNQMHEIMTEITSANREQSMGFEQVNEAIMQLDQVTQQNAALVEEASAASESMQEQATRLSELVSVFKLDEGPTLSLVPSATRSMAVRKATPHVQLPRMRA
jgi:methyl-accepting chemotaxis protein